MIVAVTGIASSPRRFQNCVENCSDCTLVALKIDALRQGIRRWRRQTICLAARDLCDERVNLAGV